MEIKEKGGMRVCVCFGERRGLSVLRIDEALDQKSRKANLAGMVEVAENRKRNSW